MNGHVSFASWISVIVCMSVFMERFKADGSRDRVRVRGKKRVQLERRENISQNEKFRFLIVFGAYHLCELSIRRDIDKDCKV